MNVAKRNVQSQSALENLANQRWIQIFLQTCGYQNKLLGAVAQIKRTMSSSL